MSKKIVQIEVVDYDEKFYRMVGFYPSFISKKDCTTISDPVDHVQTEPKINIDFNPVKENNWIKDLKLPHIENPELNAFPKLIAKKGECVKIVDLGKNAKTVDSFSQGKIYKLREDFIEGQVFRVFLDDTGQQNGLYTKDSNMKFEVCPAPVQRKSLGFYEGVEIFPETKAWDVNLKTLSIHKATPLTSFEYWEHDFDGLSKVYLSPKEADQRLKEEVEKVAMEKGLTWQQLLDWYNTSMLDVFAFAIELVEKEFGVTYLKEE